MTAPVTVTVELYLNGAWTAITGYVRLDPGIDIRFGVSAEGGVADASEATLVVNNTDGRFTPRNTSGAYYPYLKRNTPLRIKVGSTVRFLGEVSEFPARWIENENVVWTPLVASGMLRRLQHAKQLDSTLVTAMRLITAAPTDGAVTGYWPIEDEDGATSIYAEVGGAPGVVVTSPNFAEVDPGIYSKPIPTWAGAAASFFPLAGSSTQFTAAFVLVLPPTGDLTGGEELFRVDVNGTAQSWRFLYSPTAGGKILLQVISSTGVEIKADTYGTALDGGTWFVKLECSNSGANVAWALSLFGNDFNSGSLASAQVGAPTRADIGRGTIAIPATAAPAIGHVILTTGDQTINVSRFVDGLAGYAGESVDARMARLAADNGITIDVTAGATAPAEMGAQPDGSLLDVLRAAEKADAGGILRDGIGVTGNAPVLTYITRKARYNDQRSILALNYASGHLTPPLEPTDDDQQVRNQVKANREGGSSARATDATSALGSAAYPTGVGPYPFEDTYATYLDTGLPYLASWILRRGTIDETRWPALTVDLVRNSSLVTDAEALRPGHRISVSNLPTFSGVASVNLQVIGWAEHLSSHERRITFVCEPGSPFLVFQLNSSTYGHLDGAYRLAF